MKDAIREITCRKSAYENLDNKVKKLNPIIRGWRNYFANGNSTKYFIKLDEYVWTKLWRRKYIKRKQRNHYEKVLHDFKEWYAKCGPEFFYTLNKNRYVHSF